MCNILLYNRISTVGQNHDRQIVDLKLHAKSNSWEVVDVISETVSGTSKITSRGMNRELTEYIETAQLDKILNAKIDRLSI